MVLMRFIDVTVDLPTLIFLERMSCQPVIKNLLHASLQGTTTGVSA
jgi:hypothetical protein